MYFKSVANWIAVLLENISYLDPHLSVSFQLPWSPSTRRVRILSCPNNDEAEYTVDLLLPTNR